MRSWDLLVLHEAPPCAVRSSMQTMHQLLQPAWGLCAAPQGIFGIKNNPGGALVVRRARASVYSEQGGGSNAARLCTYIRATRWHWCARLKRRKKKNHNPPPQKKHRRWWAVVKSSAPRWCIPGAFPSGLPLIVASLSWTVFFCERWCSASSQAIPSSSCPKGCKWSPTLKPAGGTAGTIAWRSPGDFTLQENSYRVFYFLSLGLHHLSLQLVWWYRACLDSRLWTDKTATPRAMTLKTMLMLRKKVKTWFFFFLRNCWKTRIQLIKYVPVKISPVGSFSNCREAIQIVDIPETSGVCVHCSVLGLNLFALQSMCLCCLFLLGNFVGWFC